MAPQLPTAPLCLPTSCQLYLSVWCWVGCVWCKSWVTILCGFGTTHTSFIVIIKVWIRAALPKIAFLRTLNIYDWISNDTKWGEMSWGHCIAVIVHIVLSPSPRWWYHKNDSLWSGNNTQLTDVIGFRFKCTGAGKSSICSKALTNTNQGHDHRQKQSNLWWKTFVEFC